MANSLLDLRQIRPEPLRSEVQFGLSLAVRLCVNEEPPLVPFERQSLSCTGNQRQPPPQLGLFRPSYLTLVTGQSSRLFMAKLRSGVSIVPSAAIGARIA